MRAIQSAILLALFLLVMTLIAFVSDAQAAKKPNHFTSHTLYGDGSETNYNLPSYSYGAYEAHNQGLLHHDGWQPEDWVYDNPNFMYERFVKTGLVTNQYLKRGSMVLEVSDLFVRLSDSDKIKVLKTVDYLHGVTKDYAKGYFLVRHKRTGRTLALYSGGNVQFQ